MSKVKLFSVFALLIISAIALSGVAAALPAVIDSVKVDGTVLSPSDVNKLNVEALDNYYASCWHQSEHESFAMWKIYAPSGQGIAVHNWITDLFTIQVASTVFVFNSRWQLIY